MIDGLKISELTSGNLTDNDWVPIERSATSNYRLLLSDAIRNSIWDSYGTVRIGDNTITGVGIGNCIAIGDSAGLNAQGSDNIFIGEGAGLNVINGSFNTFIGDGVVDATTSINSSVVIGRNAGSAISPGDQCVIIGNDALTLDEDDNSIVIGYNALGAGSNTVVLGNTSIIDTYLMGNVHAGSSIIVDSINLETLNLTTQISFGGDASMSFASSAPESGATASPGSLFIDSAGGVGRKFYVKESGVGVVGWFPAGSVPSTYITGTASSLTPNAKLYSQYSITGLSSAITFNNPTDGLVDGKRLTLRYVDTGVSKSITWGGAYRAIGVTLPSATTASKLSYVQCIYNSASNVWDVTSVQTQS